MNFNSWVNQINSHVDYLDLKVQVVHMGILTDEGLGFKHETFHVLNLMHKLM